MKHILKKGEITLLLPEGEGGGLSGEVHLVKYDNQKYVIRRCPDLAKAKLYEEVSKKFEKYGFLPKFLGRFGKDVLYEYIEGRDLRKNEKMDVFRKLGKIAGYLSKMKVSGKIDERFKVQIKELETGKFNVNIKEAKRMKLNKIMRKKFKPSITKKQSELIKKIYYYLMKKVKPILTLDPNDITPSNFRLDKNRKVYFVDIEAIKPRVKGLGIAKFYLKWGKTSNKKKNFNKGYSSVASIKFLTREYLDFVYLNFIIQRMNYKYKIFGGKSYKIFPEELERIINKYKIKV